MDLTLRDCNIFTSDGWIEGDISFKDGLIYEIGRGHTAKEEIDCRERTVLPGLIDLHVHFREPGMTHKEDLSSGSLAALVSGVTTVFDMPNTVPPTTTIDRLKEKFELARGRLYCDVGFYMGYDGTNAQQILKAKDEGLLWGVKNFFGSSTESLLVTPKDVAFLMEGLDTLYLFHGEIEKILKKQNVQAESVREYPQQRPAEAALEGLKTVIELAERYHRRTHILHVSSKEEVILLANKKPQTLTAGVTPHHLFFSEKDYERLGNLLKVNPPVRREADRRALEDALFNGVIDVVETDHAPHLLEEKLLDFEQAPAGLPGIDTLFSAAATVTLKRGLDLLEVAKHCALNPARIVGLRDRGEIAEGLKGDVIVVNQEKMERFGMGHIFSKASWSPFIGKELLAKPDIVVFNGEIAVWNHSLATAAKGRVIHPGDKN